MCRRHEEAARAKVRSEANAEFVACGVWRVTCDVWRVACGVWRVACSVWRVTVVQLQEGGERSSAGLAGRS